MSAARRSWRLHRALAGVLLLEIALAASWHRSASDLERAWREGSTQERIDALHVLTNRGEPDPGRFGREFVVALLADPDDRIKELAFSYGVAKFAGSELQDEYVLHYPGVDYPHWWRSYVIFNRRVGSGRPLQRRELAWFFEAARDVAPPLAELEAHVVAERAQGERRRRGLASEATD